MAEDLGSTSRREFMAGAAALGAGMVLPITARAAAPFRIDVHHHVYPRAVMDLQEKLNPEWKNLRPPHPHEDWSPATMLDTMDRNEIATVIVSVAAPGAWYGDVAGSRRIARAWNDYAAGLAREHRGRVGFFALVALPDTEGALAEIAYAYDTLKADGVALYTSYDAKYPGDAAFAAVFDELNRREAVVFFHPLAGSCCAGLLPGVPPRVLEYPYDSTRAITSLLFSGTFSRCPDIRFIFSHGGGALPMLAGRIDELTKDVTKLRAQLPHGVPYELKRLYVDTANAASPPALTAALKLLPHSHLLYGSDYPYVEEATNIAELAQNRLPADLARAIARDNALKLFPRFIG